MARYEELSQMYQNGKTQKDVDSSELDSITNDMLMAVEEWQAHPESIEINDSYAGIKHFTNEEKPDGIINIIFY